MVFEVTLEGTARKVVTVRSSLRLVSRLSIPMELKLVNSESHTDGEYEFCGSSCKSIPQSQAS